MSYPLCVGYSGGGEFKLYCLGSLCYIKNTLYVCTTLQQHCVISLLYEQGYTANKLGAKLVKHRFGTSYSYKIL